MSKQNNHYGFWLLLFINIGLAACFGLFWSGISIVFSFFKTIVFAEFVSYSYISS